MILQAIPNISTRLYSGNNRGPEWNFVCQAYDCALEMSEDFASDEVGGLLDGSWVAMIPPDQHQTAIYRNWLRVHHEIADFAESGADGDFETWLHVDVLRRYVDICISNLSGDQRSAERCFGPVLDIHRNIYNDVSDCIDDSIQIADEIVLEHLLRPEQLDIIGLFAPAPYSLECPALDFYTCRCPAPRIYRDSYTATKDSKAKAAWLHKKLASKKEMEATPKPAVDAVKANRSGYIYAIKSSVAIKLGYTTGSPKARLSALQTAHHEKLVLLKAVEVEDVNSSERKIHDQFSAKRLNREWFAISDDEAIQALEQIA